MPRTNWVVPGLIAGLLLCALWLIGQTALFARAHADRILPGVQIAGVNVDGMTRREAVAAVGAAVDPQLDQTVRLVYLDRVWETSPRRLGASSDVEIIVAEAMDASRAVGWWDLFRIRWMGAGLNLDHGVAVVHHRPAVHALVEQVAMEINTPATRASIDYSSGWVQFIPGQPGREVAVEATVTDLVAALADGRDVVEVQTIHLPVPTGAFDTVLLLRQREHRLYLYRNGVITHSWVVATGTGDYPTPTGQYEVAEKRYMPTWINPDPEGWGKGLPASVPPGPGNPLGVRALNWSGVTGIRFHGTSDVGSLGSNASHGCVRLSNRDVVQLYDLVDVGTTIVSVR